MNEGSGGATGDDYALSPANSQSGGRSRVSNEGNSEKKCKPPFSPSTTMSPGWQSVNRTLFAESIAVRRDVLFITDITGRLVAQHHTGSWGQQTVIDNRRGGNTIIGSETLVRSAPDGYIIMLVTSAHAIVPNLIKTPYDPFQDSPPLIFLFE